MDETVSIGLKVVAELRDANQVVESFTEMKRNSDELADSISHTATDSFSKFEERLGEIGNTFETLNRQSLDDLAGVFREGSDWAQDLASRLQTAADTEKGFADLVGRIREIQSAISTEKLSKQELREYSEELERVREQVEQLMQDTGYGTKRYDQKLQESFKDVASFLDEPETANLAEAILGKQDSFEDTQRKLREFNRSLRDTERTITDINNQPGFPEKMGIGIGSGAGLSYLTRQAMAVPGAVGSHYGPLSQGMMTGLSGAIQAGAGSALGLGGLATGNPALAGAGGTLLVSGLMQTGQAVNETITGLINQAFSGVGAYQNLEVARQQMRVLFGDEGMGFTNLQPLGITQDENIGLRRQLGAVTNEGSDSLLELLSGYGVSKGIGAEGGLMLAELSRFAAGGVDEGFLKRFELLAERLEMDSGRRVELQQSVTQLSEIFYRQAGTSDVDAGLRAMAIVDKVFPDSEMSRSGAVDFLGRLQSGITSPASDAARLFMLRAAGFGQGKSLWEARKLASEGLANPEMFENIRNLFMDIYGQTTREYKYFALEGNLSEKLKPWEIERLYSAFESGTSFTDFESTIRDEAKRRGETSFFEAGVSATTGIQQWWAERQNILSDMGERLNASSIAMERLNLQLAETVGTRIADTVDQISQEGMSLGAVFSGLTGIVSDLSAEMVKMLYPRKESSSGPAEMGISDYLLLPFTSNMSLGPLALLGKELVTTGVGWGKSLGESLKGLDEDALHPKGVFGGQAPGRMRERRPQRREAATVDMNINIHDDRNRIDGAIDSEKLKQYILEMPENVKTEIFQMKRNP